MKLRIDGFSKVRLKSGEFKFLVKCSSEPVPVPSADRAGRDHVDVWLFELPDFIQLDHSYEIVKNDYVRSGKLVSEIGGFLPDESDF